MNGYILARLENCDTPEEKFNDAVLFAEITEFGPDQIVRLLDSLGQFISKNRCSTNEKTIVPLGAAIRKFAMNMSEDQFDEYANWLKPGETSYLDHRVELELVQAVACRLTYIPVSLSPVPNHLIGTLQEITNQYISQRFIVQKNYAATALEAASALILLRILTNSTHEAKAILTKVRALNRDWFQELVIDHLKEISDFLSGHNLSLSNAISEIHLP